MRYETISNPKSITVKELKSAIENMSKTANKILYESDEGGTNQRMAKLTGLTNEEGFIESKGLSSKNKNELIDQYNKLNKMISNDYESSIYRDRLNKQERHNMRKMSKTLGKNITEKQYNEMLKMWDEYGDMMNTYNYEEILDLIKKKNKHRINKPVYQLINEEQENFKNNGQVIEPKLIMQSIYNRYGL